jgi:hypothetical protein
MGQFVQLVATLPLNLPEPQYVHEGALGAEYVPPKQSVQEEAPERLDLPAEHPVQLACSLVEVK